MVSPNTHTTNLDVVGGFNASFSNISFFLVNFIVDLSTQLGILV